MSGYDYSDIIKMQNDAMRRVEEMKQNASQAVARANSEIQSVRDAHEESSRKPDKPRHVPMPDDYIRDLREYAKKATLSPRSPEKADSSLRQTLNTLTSGASQLPKAIKNVLPDLNIDNDRALLLSLILLLAEEKSDEFLIIALLYMMI